MDIPNLTSPYGDLYANAKNQAASKLESELKSDYSKATDEELMDACKQFESYLWEQVYKEMTKSVKLFGDDEDDGYASNMVDYFKDSVIQEISEQTASQGSNSLAQLLYEQAKRNYNL